MAGAGYKTFTAGEVLTASDVNTYLMQQSVQNYGGTAARSSAIPSPSTGMVSYIGDDGNGVSQIQAYNGSAWNNMGGLVLVKTQTIGTGVSSVTVTGAFSSTYENYKIIISGNGSGSTNSELRFALDGITTGYYSNMTYAAWGSTSTTPTVVRANSNAFLTWLGSFTTSSIQFCVDIYNPFLTKNKTAFGQYIENITSGGNTGTTTGFISSSASATAFTITTNAGTLTGGTIYVYGYRKA